MDGIELRRRIKALGYTQRIAADKLGLSFDGLSKQLYGVAPVSRQTSIIVELREHLTMAKAHSHRTQTEERSNAGGLDIGALSDLFSASPLAPKNPKLPVGHGPALPIDLTILPPRQDNGAAEVSEYHPLGIDDALPSLPPRQGNGAPEVSEYHPLGIDDALPSLPPRQDNGAPEVSEYHPLGIADVAANPGLQLHPSTSRSGSMPAVRKQPVARRGRRLKEVLPCR